jgi:ubiquinone/menaquinone biosynthesis C-methylase UbiE
MNIKALKIYRSPVDGSELNIDVYEQVSDEVMEGKLFSKEGHVFQIVNGIPDFTWPEELSEIDQKTKEAYDKLADDYDKYVPVMFKTYRCDEVSIRTDITDRLQLKPDSKVLDIGCGSGDSSIFIAERLGNKGELFLQELSPRFLKKSIEKLQNYDVPIEFAIANGCYLSFPDNYFDAAHHFGGLNTFSDIKRCLAELARVVKPTGKVVVGDESMAPWLRETEFGKIMMNSNPLLKYQPPIECLPTIAGDVKVEWIIMGAFYLIEFTVREAEPEANYHVMIPSDRGGSHWTRYHGNLEGVTDETKRLAHSARQKKGESMHDWLDRVVRSAAIKELEEEK